jgi:hypothetical protein
MLPALCWQVRSCQLCRTWIPNVSYRSCLERNAGYPNSSNQTWSSKGIDRWFPRSRDSRERDQNLITQLKELQRQIRSVVARVMPRLLDLPGVGAIMAGTLLAETGDPQRFPSPDHFASYCGAAPVERGSGQNTRMQINPGGNRRLNWTVHVIAIVRLRVDGGRSKEFVERHTSNGKSTCRSTVAEDIHCSRDLQNNAAKWRNVLATAPFAFLGGRCIGSEPVKAALLRARISLDGFCPMRY